MHAIHVYIMPNMANSILTSTKQQTIMTSASMYVLHVCVCVCGVHANCAHVHVHVYVYRQTQEDNNRHKNA